MYCKAEVAYSKERMRNELDQMLHRKTTRAAEADAASNVWAMGAGSERPFSWALGAARWTI